MRPGRRSSAIRPSPWTPRSTRRRPSSPTPGPAPPPAAAPVIGDWPLLAESPPGQIEYTQVWRYGVGTPGNRMALLLTATAATLNLANADWLPPADFGNNFGGPMMAIGRNANGGAEGPAAGSLMLTQA